MIKKVVVGDLGKYSSDSILRYSAIVGQDSLFSPVSSITNWKLKCCVSTKDTLGIFTGFFGTTTSIVGFFPSSTIRVRFLDSSQVDFNFPYNLDELYDMTVSYDGTTVYFEVNNGQHVDSSNISGKTMTFNAVGGGYDGVQFPYHGDVCSYKLTSFDESILYVDYDTGIRNEYGVSTVTDDSGNNNNLNVNGAQWWKLGIDENYSTPQLLKNTLVFPPVVAYDVIYTDGSPYYGSNHVFWNPYNTDPAFPFNVRFDVRSSSKYFKYFTGELSMNVAEINKTIDGVEINAGVSGGKFTIPFTDDNAYPTHIMLGSSGTAGIMKIHYHKDPVGVYRDEEISNDGVWWPKGKFDEIDVDNSGVVFDANLKIGIIKDLYK